MQTIKTLIESILGPYTAGTSQVIETTTDNAGSLITTVTTSVVIPDYAWIVSSVVFVLSLYSVYRLIGGIASWKRS